MKEFLELEMEEEEKKLLEDILSFISREIQKLDLEKEISYNSDLSIFNILEMEMKKIIGKFIANREYAGEDKSQTNIINIICNKINQQLKNKGIKNIIIQVDDIKSILTFFMNSLSIKLQSKDFQRQPMMNICINAVQDCSEDDDFIEGIIYFLKEIEYIYNFCSDGLKFNVILDKEIVRNFLQTTIKNIQNNHNKKKKKLISDIMTNLIFEILNGQQLNIKIHQKKETLNKEFAPHSEKQNITSQEIPKNVNNNKEEEKNNNEEEKNDNEEEKNDNEEEKNNNEEEKNITIKNLNSNSFKPQIINFIQNSKELNIQCETKEYIKCKITNNDDAVISINLPKDIFITLIKQNNISDLNTILNAISYEDLEEIITINGGLANILHSILLINVPKQQLLFIEAIINTLILSPYVKTLEDKKEFFTEFKEFIITLNNKKDIIKKEEILKDIQTNMNIYGFPACLEFVVPNFYNKKIKSLEKENPSIISYFSLNKLLPSSTTEETKEEIVTIMLDDKMSIYERTIKTIYIIGKEHLLNIRLFRFLHNITQEDVRELYNLFSSISFKKKVSKIEEIKDRKYSDDLSEISTTNENLSNNSESDSENKKEIIKTKTKESSLKFPDIIPDIKYIFFSFVSKMMNLVSTKEFYNPTSLKTLLPSSTTEETKESRIFLKYNTSSIKFKSFIKELSLRCADTQSIFFSFMSNFINLIPIRKFYNFDPTFFVQKEIQEDRKESNIIEEYKDISKSNLEYNKYNNSYINLESEESIIRDHRFYGDTSLITDYMTKKIQKESYLNFSYQKSIVIYFMLNIMKKYIPIKNLYLIEEIKTTAAAELNETISQDNKFLLKSSTSQEAIGYIPNNLIIDEINESLNYNTSFLNGKSAVDLWSNISFPLSIPEKKTKEENNNNQFNESSEYEKKDESFYFNNKDSSESVIIGIEDEKKEESFYNESYEISSESEYLEKILPDNFNNEDSSESFHTIEENNNDSSESVLIGIEDPNTCKTTSFPGVQSTSIQEIKTKEEKTENIYNKENQEENNNNKDSSESVIIGIEDEKKEESFYNESDEISSESEYLEKILPDNFNNEDSSESFHTIEENNNDSSESVLIGIEGIEGIEDKNEIFYSITSNESDEISLELEDLKKILPDNFNNEDSSESFHSIKEILLESPEINIEDPNTCKTTSFLEGKSNPIEVIKTDNNQSNENNNNNNNNPNTYNSPNTSFLQKYFFNITAYLQNLLPNKK